MDNNQRQTQGTPFNANSGDQQRQENLVLSFSGYKTPLVLSAQQTSANSASYSQPQTGTIPYQLGQQYLLQGNTQQARTTPPTLGQIASRIKEKASAAKKHHSSEEFMDTDGGEEDDEDEDQADGDDNDGDNANNNDQSTGRWTKKEHELFLAALKKYGKEWKKVAQMVKTRTVVQTRTHAQKYFQKLAKSTGGHADLMMLDDSMDLHNSTSIASSAPATQSQQKSAKRARRAQTPPDAEQYPMSYPAASFPNNNSSAFKALNHPLYNVNNNILANDEEEDADFISRPLFLSGNTIDPNLNSNLFNNPLLNASVLPINRDAFMGMNNKSTAINRDALSDNVNGNVLPVGLRDLPVSTSSPPGSFFKRARLGQSGSEFKAAQLLVTSTSGSNAVLDFEGAQMLSSLRQDSGNETNNAAGSSGHNAASSSSSSSNNNNNSNTLTLSAQQKLKKIRPLGLTLSIANPGINDMYTVSNNRSVSSEPGTPWDSQIRALHARYQPFNTPSSAKTPNSSNHFPEEEYISVSTPAEQKQFLNKIQNFIRNGDVEGLKRLVNTAIQTYNAFMNNIAANSGSFNINNHNNSNFNSSDNATVSSATTSDSPFASVPVNNINNINNNINNENNAILRLLRQSDLPLLCEAISLDLSVFSADVIYDLVALLVSYGVSVQNTSKAFTDNSPLHIAAQQGLVAVGQLLIESGANIDCLNHDGNAPVHLAAIAGHGQFLELLAEKHANVHLRNSEALSAMDLAGYVSKDPGEREVLRRLLLSKDRRLRTLILYHADFMAHSTRTPSDWEGPDRLSAIVSRLKDKQEFPAYEIEISDRFEKADVTLLGRVHSPEYLAFVNDLHKQVQRLQLQQQQQTNVSRDTDNDKDDDDTGDVFVKRSQHPTSATQQKTQTQQSSSVLPFTPQVQRALLRHHSQDIKPAENCDTSFSLGTLTAARRAAGAVAHAIDCVLAGDFRNAFCCVRPPGHHSGYQGLLNGANSCGFCIFNNVAAGAFHALEEHKCERVAIIDLDIHHGNGTEEIVKMYPHPSRLFFFSVHLYDHEPTGGYHFYPGTGERNDYMHNIINVPIHPLWRNPQKYPDLNPPPPQTQTTPVKTETVAAVTPATTNSDNPKNNPSTNNNNNNNSKNNNSAEKPPNDNTPSGVSKEVSSEEKQLYGREAYRQAISQRLLPTLRAFHPDLILLSMGFDAASGDVGNCRHSFPATSSSTSSSTANTSNSTNNTNSSTSTSTSTSTSNTTPNTSATSTSASTSTPTGPVAGMDLLPEDFAWVTTEILKIADICCQGRVVSVLEGGYGEYDPHHHTSGHSVVNSNYSLRSAHKAAASSTHAPPSVAEAKGSNNSSNSSGRKSPGEIDAFANRESLMNRQRLAEGVAAHVHRLIDPYGPLRISSSKQTSF